MGFRFKNFDSPITGASLLSVNDHFSGLNNFS